MKNIFLTFAISLCVLTASAQIPKGSIFAGLDLSYYSNNSESSNTNGGVTQTNSKYTYSYLNLGPSAQYFVADNFSVGLGVGISNNKNSNENPISKDKNSYSSDGTNFNIFARKYLNCGTNFYTFFELKINMSSSKGSQDQFNGTNSTTTTTKNEYSNSGGSINVGFAWLLTERLMVQSQFGMIGYSMYTQKTNINAAGDNYNSSKGSGLNFGIFTGDYVFNLGFAYRLNK
jgi:hypothetical protein